MEPEIIIDLMRTAIYITMLMVAVIIVPSLMVGLIVSMFQAATQINEQTLSFLPRFVITFVVLAVAGPWIFLACWVDLWKSPWKNCTDGLGSIS
jgi:flagellar biosynthetic protein FliQ